MNKPYFVASLLLFIMLLTANGSSLPKYGVTKLESLNKEYSIRLADTKDPWIYELRIFRNNIELAHYPFEEELLSAYWSPSLKFVAVNNHNGHGGFYVWIISLADGSVVTSHGVVKDPNYDKYSDDNDFVDLREQAAGKLKQIYPQADTDQLRNGYNSVAYGWRGDNQLLMFHEFGFDNFYTKYHLIIQAFTLWDVTTRGVTLKNVRFRKARDDQYEPMPPEVKKTLNFIR